MKVFTADNFQSAVLESEKPVLVDFWMDACTPCRLLEPTLEELSCEFENCFDVGKVNVAVEAPLAEKYSITAVPTMLLFQGGQLKQTLVGLLSQQEIEEVVLDALGYDHVDSSEQ